MVMVVIYLVIFVKFVCHCKAGNVEGNNWNLGRKIITREVVMPVTQEKGSKCSKSMSRWRQRSHCKCALAESSLWQTIKLSWFVFVAIMKFVIACYSKLMMICADEHVDSNSMEYKWVSLVIVCSVLSNGDKVVSLQSWFHREVTVANRVRYVSRSQGVSVIFSSLAAKLMQSNSESDVNSGFECDSWNETFTKVNFV